MADRDAAEGQLQTHRTCQGVLGSMHGTQATARGRFLRFRLPPVRSEVGQFRKCSNLFRSHADEPWQGGTGRQAALTRRWRRSEVCCETTRARNASRQKA